MRALFRNLLGSPGIMKWHREERGAGVTIESILALAVGILILMAILQMMLGSDGAVSRAGEMLAALARGESLSGSGDVGDDPEGPLPWDPPSDSGGTTSGQYVVPGIMAARDQLAQGHDWLCWAYSYAMLAAWRQQQSLEVRPLLEDIGEKWVDRYDNNKGISWAEGKEFANAAGLTTEPVQSVPLSRWEELLRKHGPLLLMTKNSSLTGGHARVLYGVDGDGTPGGTTMLILDPWNGTDYRESYKDFIARYEPTQDPVVAHY